MLKSPVDSKTDTFCPIAYFFLFMLSKVLTRFYLPMGATLIPGACMPGFEVSPALDAPVALQLCLLLLAWILQGIPLSVMFTFIGTIFARDLHSGYVNKYWHGSCIRKTGHFLSSRDFRSLNVLDKNPKMSLK